MIELTPLEVRQKKGDFRRAVRGYDPDLVDDFLDLVADRLEALVRETMALGDKVKRLEEELAAFREREQALTDALMTAQEARDETRRQATKEAELIRREAEVEAERIRTEAIQAREREADVLRRIRARRIQLIRSYRTFLERELNELAVTEEALELDADGDGDEEARVPVPATSEPAAEPAAEAAPEPTPEPAPEEEGTSRQEAEPPGTEWLSSLLKEEDE